MRQSNNILVIGGGGFIGEYTVAALHKHGHAVTAPLRSELDMKDVVALRAQLALHDSVIVLTQPDLEGITALASALALSDVKHVLYVSTGLLYASSETPQQEDAPLAALTAYEQAKLAEENILGAVKGGHLVTIVRLGNVYGGLKNKGIVAKALRAMYGGEKLIMSGESQVRDFVHVTDVAEALVHLVRTPCVGVVNVGTGEGVSLDKLLALLEEVAQRPIPWVRGKEGVVKDVVLDINILQTSGFTPKIRLGEGLRAAHQEYARSIR